MTYTSGHIWRVTIKIEFSKTEAITLKNSEFSYRYFQGPTNSYPNS